MSISKNGSVRRWCSLALFAGSLAITNGCSDEPPTTPVAGKVTYHGTPLRFGTIMFQHQSGGQPSRGAIQADGSYRLSTFQLDDGARPGRNLVRITCFEGNDPDYKSGAPEGEIVLGKSLIPRRYNSFGSSGVSVDVAPDKPQTLDFELND